MEPSATPPPPPPEPVETAKPGQPTAGVADTRTVGRSYAPIAAAELVGTTVLILAGPGSAILAGDKIGNLGVALSFGFALLIMAYVIGPISGCQINPAVTLGLLLSRKISLRHAVYAWIAQVVGGIFGAAIIYGIASGREGWSGPGEPDAIEQVLGPSACLLAFHPG